MDKIPQPNKGRTTAATTLADKCRVMDDLFHEHHLTELKFEIPGVGLVSAVADRVACVRRYICLHPSANDDAFGTILHPMQIVWEYAPQKGFIRKLQQELTKPLNIHLSMTKMPGFNYRLRQKENVVISRLLVDPRDIDEAINLLIDEANRFYILYCHTL